MLQNSQPTIGQLEREITNRIRCLYKAQLGQIPSKIICHFFDTEVVITIENSLTIAEQTVMKAGYEALAGEFRLVLDKIIQQQIKNLIESVIEKSVIDVVGNTNLITGRTGMIAVLQQHPEVRNPQSIPKVKLQSRSR